MLEEWGSLRKADLVSAFAVLPPPTHLFFALPQETLGSLPMQIPMYFLPEHLEEM
jgi:hypothetical protein